MSVFLAKGKTREMFYCGPLRSGVTLDSRALMAEGYAWVQKDVYAALNEVTGTWQWPDMEADDRASKMIFDVDNMRGETIIPRFFISRHLMGDALLKTLEPFNLPTELYQGITQDDGDNSEQPLPPSNAGFLLREMEIRLYDFGYASVMFRGAIKAEKDLTLDEFRVAAQKLSSELSLYNDVFMNTIRMFEKAVPPEFILVNAFNPVMNQRGRDKKSMAHTNIGRLAWVHRIFHVACEDKEELSQRKEDCKKLIYSTANGDIEDSSLTPDMAIYVGDGNSVTVYDKTRTTDWDMSLLRRLVQHQNVCFITIEDLDRDLFMLGNEVNRKRDTQDMQLLENQSRQIVDFQSQISFFRAVYDDYDNYLDPQSLKIWHDIEDCWQTRDRLEGLDTKMQQTEKIYDRIMRDLANLHNKKLTMFVLIFTVLSMLSVIVDTVDFTQGGELTAPSMIRLALLGMMALTVLALANMLAKRKTD